jgi:hypothetical protein
MMKIEMLLFLKNLLIVGLLNETTCLWEAPVAKPNDDGIYTWNETIQNWEQI